MREEPITEQKTKEEEKVWKKRKGSSRGWGAKDQEIDPREKQYRNRKSK